MKFQSSTKNLRLIVKTPWREVQNGYPINHEGEYVIFDGGYFDTDDEAKITWLKAHRLFSETQDVLGKFWVWTAPVDTKKLLEEKENRIKELEAELEETKKIKKEPIRLSQLKTEQTKEAKTDSLNL